MSSGANSGWVNRDLRARLQRRGFTLLEVMLAVAIIGLISLSIFRFVDSTLRVVQTINQGGGVNDQLDALCRAIQFQINDLPSTDQGGILGQPHIFSGLAADEFQWRARSGNGLFTAHATGEYRVTLTVQTDQKRNQSELGLRRMLIPGDQNDPNWLPLIPGIRAFEARYFQVSSNQWQEKWTAQNERPNLVRLKFWSDQAVEPYEVVLTIPKLAHMPIPNGAAGNPQPVNPRPPRNILPGPVQR